MSKRVHEFTNSPLNTKGSVVPGAQRMGAAIEEMFAAEGASVVVNCASSKTERVVSAIRTAFLGPAWVPILTKQIKDDVRLRF